MVLQVIRSHGWAIEKILLTHGHFDHTGAVATLSQRLGIPYYIYPADDRYLADPVLNLSGNFNRNEILLLPEFIHDGEEIRLAADDGFSLKAIHTPGHTPGSVTYYSAKNAVAFVGDTLYEHNVGLTEFPGGNRQDIEKSIVTKILSLPDNTILLSGHSSPITVGEEKRLILSF